MGSSSLCAEDLLQHADWLRALARRLVGEAYADDVLQETWTTALERPPRSRAALPAWLAQVTRNAARQLWRSESARHKREARTARVDLDVSAAAVVERADLHRQLVEEVMSLEEPYRQVLLLRWFEGHEPKEIAALLGVSAGTVRSQLKRGLERLRERLDRRFDDRKTWIGAFVPIAFGRPARVAVTGGSGLTGGLLLFLKSQAAPLLLAALVLGGVLVAVLAVASLGGDPARENTGTPSLGEAPLIADRASPPRPAILFGRAPAERRGLGDLTARVARVDTGAAVSGAPILLSGRSLADEDVQVRTTTDAQGRFALAQLPAGDAYALHVGGPDLPPLELGSIVVTAGRTDDLGTLWLGMPGTLEGRVLDASNRPVVGARVRVYKTVGASRDFVAQIHEVFSSLDREPTPEAATTTDRDGRFHFETLSPGLVSVTASSPGLVPVYASAAVVPGAPSAALVLRLPTGREVRGRVVDESGRPLVGARVASVPGGPDLDAVTHGRRFTSSDAQGRFTFPNVADDEGLILIAAYGSLPAVMSEFTRDQNDVTLVVRGGTTLDVRVMAAGGQTPVADAEVTLLVGPTDEPQMRDVQTFLVGRTDARGYVQLDTWPGYVQMAVISHPDHAPGLWVGTRGAMRGPGVVKGPERSKLEPGRHRMEFTLPEGTSVRGRVLDPQGRGIAGARVRAVRFLMPSTGSVRSDGTGRYRLVMPFGSELRVEAPGFAQSPDSVLVIRDSEPAEIAEHDVVMEEAAALTGRVLLPDGSPAAGALVRFRNANREGPLFSAATDRQVFARADGRFWMDSVAPGDRWHALARLPGFVGGTAGPFVVGRGGETRTPDIVLVGGVTLEVTVCDETGKALPDATVGTKNDVPTRLAWDPMDIENRSRVTDADGVAVVDSLTPGTHEVYVVTDGYVPFSERVDLSAEDRGPMRRRVVLARGRVIQGRVREEGDGPIEGARILVVSDAAPAHPVLVTSDATGRFEAAGLAPASVNLEIRADGYRLAKQSSAEGEEALDIRLAPVDPSVAARRAELKAEEEALYERLGSNQYETARRALVENLHHVRRELRALEGE